MDEVAERRAVQFNHVRTELLADFEQKLKGATEDQRHWIHDSVSRRAMDIVDTRIKLEQIDSTFSDDGKFRVSRGGYGY